MKPLKKSFSITWKKITRFDFYIRLFLLPILLLGVLGIFVILIIHTQLQIVSLRLRSAPMTETFAPYPKLQTSFVPDISASTAIVMDTESDVILYQKNPVIQSSMASTTKIMTALVALEHFAPTDIITVQRNIVEGSGLHLFSGEQFTFSDMLYAMFLPSANDAAMAVTDNYPGGQTAFVAAMNKKAKELHLYHTAYQDPAGLEDNGDYSTVIDLARLASFVLSQPTLRQVVATQYKYISTIDKVNSYQLENLNKLLGTDGVIGIKTGTTDGAGQVLITAKQDGEHTYVIIVMDSIDRYADTVALLRLIDNNVIFLTPEQMVSEVGK